ncbi:MAG: alpha/beta hydrolase family protein, partial [Phenylobacterium sp.]
TLHGLGVGEAKVRDVQWAGPSHIILMTSVTAKLQDFVAPRAEYFRIFDYNLETQKLAPLLRDAPGMLPLIFDAPVVRVLGGKPYLYVQTYRFNSSGQSALALFRIDLATDRTSMMEAGGVDSRDWLVGDDGVAAAQVAADAQSGRWVLKLKAGAGWRENRTIEAKVERPNLIGLGRDAKSVLIGERVDGSVQIREVSPEGVWSEPLKLQGDATIFDPLHHNLIGLRTLEGDEVRYSFFDPKDRAAWAAVRKALAADQATLVSWSDDRSKFVVATDSATEGPAYCLVDLESGAVSRVGVAYESLRPDDISPVRPVRFKAQDGLELSGYLTTPRGRDAQTLPLVVFPHGGPAVRDGPGFDWWAQAMASRGYAVLQVNFRGSDGFGWKFLEAGFGQWGRKMQTDLSDGVRELARQGVVDPKRVCIVGGSYGGYAALAGPTLDPGVYRCAASYGGISDLRTFAPWVRSQNGVGSQRYLIRFIGAESARDPSMSEISPAAHADKVSVPILLIHGKDDTVVPLEQSQRMADALKAAGKPVELVVLDGTD